MSRVLMVQLRVRVKKLGEYQTIQTTILQRVRASTIVRFIWNSLKTKQLKKCMKIHFEKRRPASDQIIVVLVQFGLTRQQVNPLLWPYSPCPADFSPVFFVFLPFSQTPSTSHNSGNLKKQLLSTVIPTVHTDTTTLLKPEEFENDDIVS